MRQLLARSMAVVAAVAWPVLVWAQEAPKEFVPAESVPRPEIPPAPLLYGAYAFVWAVLLIYVFFLWRRIGRVERELADVNRKLAARR